MASALVAAQGAHPGQATLVQARSKACGWRPTLAAAAIAEEGPHPGQAVQVGQARFTRALLAALHAALAPAAHAIAWASRMVVGMEEGARVGAYRVQGALLKGWRPIVAAAGLQGRSPVPKGWRAGAYRVHGALLKGWRPNVAAAGL